MITTPESGLEENRLLIHLIVIVSFLLFGYDGILLSSQLQSTGPILYTVNARLNWMNQNKLSRYTLIGCTIVLESEPQNL